MLLPAGNTGDIEMHDAPPLSGESTIAPQASQLDPSNTETQHESSLATSNQPSRHSSRRNTRIDYAALDRGELDLRSATPVEISEEQQKETEARRKHEIELQKRRERYAQRKLQLKQEAEASKSNTPEANPTTSSVLPFAPPGSPSIPEDAAVLSPSPPASLKGILKKKGILQTSTNASLSVVSESPKTMTSLAAFAMTADLPRKRVTIADTPDIEFMLPSFSESPSVWTASPSPGLSISSDSTISPPESTIPSPDSTTPSLNSISPTPELSTPLQVSETPTDESEISTPTSTSSRRKSKSPKPRRIAKKYSRTWNKLRKNASQAQEIFTAWGRTDITAEIAHIRSLQSADPDLHAVLTLRKKIHDGLRERDRIYIQRAVPDDRCQYPPCLLHFKAGSLRVSFEPRSWTQPPSAARVSRSAGVLLDPDFAIPDNYDDCKEIPSPVYDVLRAASEHGEGFFFCLHCFENLLDEENIPEVALNSKDATLWATEQLAYRNPSGYVGVYTFVHPDTREGVYALDERERRVVVAWKKAVCRAKYRELAMGVGLEDSEDEGDEEEEAKAVGFVWRCGMGVPEALGVNG